MATRNLDQDPASIQRNLLRAAETVLDGLNARIDAAPPSAVPIFSGIVDLHDAIARARGQRA